ncbi:hypothetical protein T484DRAFT_1831320 [Baffinella frigidus]|nr:hypothetical protein T484DRAFT_1831320 [Cryptophyta sp. CCMP2293]
MAAVSDAEVSLPFKVRGRKKTLRERGPVLVTHSGVSGPAVLRLSAFGAREMHEVNDAAKMTVKYSAKMTVNWLPDIDRGEAGATEQMTVNWLPDIDRGEAGATEQMTVNWLPDIDRGEAGATEQHA